MWKIFEIAALILLPLAWGLFVEFVFERVRGRRSAGPGRPGGDKR